MPRDEFIALVSSTLPPEGLSAIIKYSSTSDENTIDTVRFITLAIALASKVRYELMNTSN